MGGSLGTNLVSNLLQNAARYTPSEGQIRITLARQELQVWIRVQDTGCGIAPAHLPHLGERFYRADSGRGRKQGGTGLGLAICRSIVTRHQEQMHKEIERARQALGEKALNGLNTKQRMQ